MSLNLNVNLERFIEYPALGLVVSSSSVVNLVIDIKSLASISQDEKLAQVSYTITSPDDSNISLARDDAFSYTSIENLEAEASAYLTRRYEGQL